MKYTGLPLSGKVKTTHRKDAMDAEEKHEG